MLQRFRRARLRTRAGAVGAAVAVLVVTGGAVYWFGLRESASATPAEPTSQAVAASLQTLEKSVSASGTLSPVVQESVSFAASGTVTSVPVTAGETVAVGQTLATIDTLSLTADLLSAKATLAAAQADLVDSKDADDGSDAAEAQIAARAAKVEVAQAAVDTATEAMADATLVAPVAGLLTDVSLSVGDVVAGSSGNGSPTGSASTATASQSTTDSSSAQFVIVGTDAWQVDVTVDDGDVALIAVGDQAELTLDGVTDPIFGTVSEIGLIPSTTSGVTAYPVTVAVTGRPDGVYDGVSADAEIVYERRTDVLTVPAAAVRTVDGQTVVLQTGADGAEVSTPVTVGDTVGDLTEIVDGLAEGDEVLVTIVTPSTTGTGSTGQQRGQMPTGVVPGQLPEGFDPSQLGGPGGGNG